MHNSMLDYQQLHAQVCKCTHNHPSAYTLSQDLIFIPTHNQSLIVGVMVCDHAGQGYGNLSAHMDVQLCGDPHRTAHSARRGSARAHEGCNSASRDTRRRQTRGTAFLRVGLPSFLVAPWALHPLPRFNVVGCSHLVSPQLGLGIARWV